MTSEDIVIRDLRRRVGKTPLVRARGIEKEFGIESVYLKLEGNNPSGHREDRLAYLIIRDAISKGFSTICMGTYGTMGRSLAFLMKYFDMELVLYTPEKHIIQHKDFLNAPNVRMVRYGKTYEDCVVGSREDAEQNGWYNANPGLQNNIMNMFAFSYIAQEIYNQLPQCPDTVFCQTGNGASISGLHLGFKQIWVNEQIDIIPSLFAVSTDHGNAIIESYKKGSEKIIDLNPETIRKKATRYNRNLIMSHCYNGQDALDSILASNGKAVGVTDDELNEYAHRFKKIERIKFRIQNFFPIAAFLKEYEAGNLEAGIHVVIINDGKIDIDIRTLDKNDLTISYTTFLEKLDDWLIRFSDPSEEIEEAVENAFQHGFVLGAYFKGALAGVAIVSRTRFDTFFPKYHLSYIATKKDIKGMGIATQLMQKVIEHTNGDFSLHVEIENTKAIRLYEKMGLRKKYYRMLYKGDNIKK